MTHAVHLSDDLLIRALDEELTTDERLFAERHLAACPICRERRRQWAELSDRVQDHVAAAPIIAASSARERLAVALGAAPDSSVAETRKRRWAWPMAGIASAAACLLVLLAGPFWKTPQPHVGTHTNLVGSAHALVGDRPEEEGDFIPLPYSMSEAAPGMERIVRVELPASSLVAEGILPSAIVDSSTIAGDQWVVADLALGLDGQPAGIRLVDEPVVRN